MAGVLPEDFGSPHRERRMWACAMRGDLEFEGTLLSNANQLSRYQPSLDGRRMFHHQRQVLVGSRYMAWDGMTSLSQIHLIDGYAAGVTGALCTPGVCDSHDDFWWSGYQRGVAAEAVRQMIAAGHVPLRLLVVAPGAPDRQLAVRNARPDTKLGFGYVAEIAPNQFHVVALGDDSRTTTWTGLYHFEIDAVV